MSPDDYNQLVNDFAQICLDEIGVDVDFEEIDTHVCACLNYSFPLEDITLVEAAQIIELYATFVCPTTVLWENSELHEALKTQAWYSLKEDIVFKVKSELNT